MYSGEVPQPTKSKRLMWVGIAGAIVLLVIIIVAIFAIAAPREDTSAPVADAQAEAPASNDEVKQDMAVLEAAIKQSDADKADAKAALQSDSTRIKVSD